MRQRKPYKHSVAYPATHTEKRKRAGTFNLANLLSLLPDDPKLLADWLEIFHAVTRAVEAKLQSITHRRS